jgi:hypothetical protein
MQLEQNLKIAESDTPMTDAERLAFFRDILPLVRPEKTPWKTTGWEKPVEWIKIESLYLESVSIGPWVL